MAQHADQTSTENSWQSRSQTLELETLNCACGQRTVRPFIRSARLRD